MDSTEPQHPISYAAKRSGLSTHAIRAWERRYGAVSPNRTDTKRRLYSDAEIERLRLLAALTKSGHTIQRLAPLETEALRTMIRDLREPSPQRAAPDTGAAPLLEDLMRQSQEVTSSFDAVQLDAILQQARVTLPLIVLLEELVAPYMTWVGEQWHAGQLRVGHEHVASATVRAFLMRIRRSMATQPNAHLVLVATPAGELHEIGALLASVAAVEAGWRELYLGPNVPAAELANVALTAGARVIALSFAASAGTGMLDELADLRQFVGPDMPILAGGSGVAPLAHRLEEHGVRAISSLRAFQEALNTL
jgi:DNA-binding transcriptional MerR regulator/methylmalonyl-CoA mutase cobalamin-binding subunit